MANIEAIIVDGVRYDKVKAKTEFVCEECELREACEEDKDYAVMCGVLIAELGECWKKKGETMKERKFNKGDIVALHFNDASSIGYNGVVAIVKNYFYDKVVNEWKYLCDSKYGSSCVWAFENEMILQK